MSPDQHEDFRSLGEILRDCRKERGLSLEDVSEATKISPRMLHALEADEIDQLAGPIYARGFVKTLARFLDQDEGALLAKLESLDQEAAPVELPVHLEHEEERVEDQDAPSVPEAPSKAEPVTWQVETVEDTAVKRVVPSSPAWSSRWTWIVLALLVLVLVVWWLGKGSREEQKEPLNQEVSTVSREAEQNPAAQSQENNLGTEVVEPSGNTLKDAVPQPSPAMAKVDLQNAVLAGGSTMKPAGKGERAAGEERASSVEKEGSAKESPKAAAETEPKAERKKTKPSSSEEELPSDTSTAQTESASEKEGPAASQVKTVHSRTNRSSAPARAEREKGSSAKEEGSRLGSIVRPGVEPPVAGQMHLELTALVEVEVWASADGEDSQHRVLQPNESWSLLGWDHFSLRLSDPDAVEVKLDGVLRRPPRGLRDEWIIYPPRETR